MAKLSHGALTLATSMVKSISSARHHGSTSLEPSSIERGSSELPRLRHFGLLNATTENKFKSNWAATRQSRQRSGESHEWSCLFLRVSMSTENTIGESSIPFMRKDTYLQTEEESRQSWPRLGMRHAGAHSPRTLRKDGVGNRLLPISPDHKDGNA